MNLPAETKHCINCGRVHEFYYGWPSCDPDFPHGFMSASNSFSTCRFCHLDSRSLIHDRSGSAVTDHCTNCGSIHWFIHGWPSCDPYQPHGFMTHTGMEGRCQHCGGPFHAYLHNKELR